MTQRHLIWSALSRYAVAWVKFKQVAWFSLLLTGLVLSGCAGNVTVAPVGKHAKGSRWSPAIHEVSRGETLYSIAFQYGQDYRSLARRNGIRLPYTIYAGQKLKLRGKTKKVKTVSKKETIRHKKTAKKTSKSSQTRKKTRKTVLQAKKPQVKTRRLV